MKAPFLRELPPKAAEGVFFSGLSEVTPSGPAKPCHPPRGGRIWIYFFLRSFSATFVPSSYCT